jgi:CubicO group peptidase (beta-lactamase class C family)
MRSALTDDYTQQHKVTLRRLLSHTGGFTGGDFSRVIAAGKSLPSLPQVLDGAPPATNAPLRVGFEPGTQWHYSGDDYLVMQQLVTDVSGESFPDFMRTTIFEKLGIERQCDCRRWDPHEWQGRVRRLARKPRNDSGGLWSTPTDLTKLAIELALSARGKGNQILTQSTARDILTPHWKEGVINIFGHPPRPGPDGTGLVRWHSEGTIRTHRWKRRYQATLVMFAGTDDGVVIMTNYDFGLDAGNALLDKIAEVYRWDYVVAPLPSE